MKRWKIILAGFFSLFLFEAWVVFSEETEGEKKKMAVKPPFYSVKRAWADSVMKTMTPDERIAQLFMVAAYSNRDSLHEKEITGLVEKQKIGGLIFFQGGPVRQAQLTNRFQSKSKIPLLVAMDAEWGLSMRIDSTIRFPKQMTLGAIQNDTLIYYMGREIAYQCKRLGVHVSFSPVADINNNPKNPIINARSFGEDKKNVTRKAVSYMLGLQKENVIACGKHFPGHGDTETDSHLGLPVVHHLRAHLDSLELVPFRVMMNLGLSSVMVAHLHIPSLDDTENLATTLSSKVVKQLLKTEMKFEGLVFTDALNMKGVSSFYEPGEVDVKALLAGNDVLLFSENVPEAIDKIKEAIKKGEITQKEIDERCYKILLAKTWVGLDKYKPVEIAGLNKDLNRPYARMLNGRLYENALTLLENEGNILPLMRLDTLKIAAVSIGDSVNNEFQQSLERYANIGKFSLSSVPRGNEMGVLLEKLKGYNLFIFCVHGNTLSRSHNYNVSQEAIAFINNINQQYKTIVVQLSNAYALSEFPGASLAEGLILGYENVSEVKDAAAQLIFGGIKCNGKIPVSASEYFKAGSGMEIKKPVRFKYALPEDLGINSEDFLYVDSVAIEGIKEKAYPGCVVLVAKSGKIIYNKAFGHHMYDSLQPMKNSDIFDLASVTKITSTVSILMKLHDEGKFSLDKTLGDYLPDIVDSTVYANIVIRKMLAHQAGLVAWIPFYLNTMKDGNLKSEYYRKVPSDSFSFRVADSLYILNTYRDSIFKTILKTDLLKHRRYLYSDVGYYFLQEYIERTVKMPVNRYADSVFFSSLGCRTLGFKPRNRFPLERIVPTELDNAYRKQLLRGDVHDQGAAMLGGVGGHAGLFGNANDVAIMLQMMMNYGEYGGVRYLKEATVKEFTRCQFCPNNRRGAGFDRPTMDEGPGPTCNCVSPESFGHTGYTGITVWADPGEQLVYVFLSNRSHPVGDNPKILKLSIRTRIQQAIYDAVNNRDKKWEF